MSAKKFKRMMAEKHKQFVESIGQRAYERLIKGKSNSIPSKPKVTDKTDDTTKRGKKSAPARKARQAAKRK